MAMVDDTEMPRIESEAVSSSDDGKIVADTQDFIDESSLVVRTATGVRISPQFGEQSLVDSNGSKLNPLGVAVPAIITLPAKNEVISDGFACVNKEIVESDPFRAVKLEICAVKEELDLNVENQVSSGTEEEMIIDSIERSVVETVSSALVYDCNVKVEVVEPELHVETVVVVKEEEVIIDSIEKSVVETVSRGLAYECVNVNVKVKAESGLGTKLEEDSVFSKDEVIRVQEGHPSEIHVLLQESKKLEQDNDLFSSGDLDGTSAKRMKMEMEPSESIGVKSCILAPMPLRVLKPENLDNPEVIDLESENLNVKMEPVEEKKVDAAKLSLQVKEMKYSREQKPVYVKKETVETRKVKVEDGDFPVEINWYLVGRSLVTATSTSKGRKLEDNEIVNFTFSSAVSWKVPNIVRFSTKRCGEVSRFFFYFEQFDNYTLNMI